MELVALSRFKYKKAFFSSIIVFFLCFTESKDTSRLQFNKYFDSTRHNENHNDISNSHFLTPNSHFIKLGASNLVHPNQSNSFSSSINSSQIIAVPGTVSYSSSNNVGLIDSRGIWHSVPSNQIPSGVTKEYPSKGTEEYPREIPIFKEIVIDKIYRAFSNRSLQSLSRDKRRVAENLVGKDGNGPSSRSLDFDENPFVKGRKHTGVNPKIDDIIHGIMKLLGGNVKLKAPESTETKLTTFNDNASQYVTSTRINNRGPPRLPIMPFGLLPPVVPIRPPVTPPAEGNHPNGPQFVANTRPPFLVPLPPALSNPGSKAPFVTGIPIPEDVLSHIKMMSVKPSEDTVITTSVTPSFSDATEDSEVNTIDSSLEETKENIVDDKNIDVKITDEEFSSTYPSSVVELSSVTALESSFETSSSTPSVDITTKSITIKSINLISSKATPSLNNIKSSSLIITASGEHPDGVLQSPTPTEVPVSKTQSSEMSSTLVSSITSPPLVDASTLPPSLAPSPTSTFAFSNFPTLLPGPIKPYATTGHPGMVLEDVVTSASVYQGEVITAYPLQPFNLQPDVFDVTVSALQGYGSSPVQPPKRYEGVVPLVTTAKKPADGSVFIDGRKTYFDLLPATNKFSPGGIVNQVQTMGVGTVIPEAVEPPPTFSKAPFFPPAAVAPPPMSNNLQRATRPPNDRSTTLGPPKRIDTCIVGYDTTCKEELGEVCRTEGDVSSCFCRPGTARKKSRSQCKKSVLLHLSLKVDRVGNRRIVWSGNYANPEAKEYQMLHYEAEKALDSALGQSRAMSGLYMESSVNKFYSLGGRVIVNSTVKLLHTPQTASPTIRKSLQRHLIRIIQTNNNYVGNSVLAVEGPLNPIPDVSDVNECFDSSLYDCHSEAVCTNTFGSYTCDCKKGFTDRYPDDPNKSGRYCDSCSRDFCNKRGECRIEEGYHICVCEDKYYGARCEIDGEVIAVAVGASVAAVVIIILTLIFLCMWSQRWKAQDRKTEILSRLPGGLFAGFRGRGGLARETFAVDVHQKGHAGGAYGISMEDRIRWAQIAENLAQQNVYTQPEQMRSTAFYEQRKVLPPPSEYASVGTISAAPPPQHFGMHQMNPPHFIHHPYASKNHTYNQFGPHMGNSVPSVGGISRAPTIGARTPLPVRDLLGGTSMGPFGGGIATKHGNKDGIGALLTESSEEDPDRPYQLPRPKSRSSALDNDDFYFDPDDMMTSQPSRFLPPLPSSPPPPVPYQFDQFFKSKFP